MNSRLLWCFLVILFFSNLSLADMKEAVGEADSRKELPSACANSPLRLLNDVNAVCLDRVKLIREQCINTAGKSWIIGSSAYGESMNDCSRGEQDALKFCFAKAVDIVTASMMRAQPCDCP